MIISDIQKKKLLLIKKLRDLANQQFKDWFVFFYNCIEGHPPVIQEAHDKLYNAYQDIYDRKLNYVNINIFPRIGKTTTIAYFIAYTIANNQKSKFLYISANQIVLNDVSQKLTALFKNPLYKLAYSTDIKVILSTFDRDKKEYITSKNIDTFSKKIIALKGGGKIYFCTPGGQITGLAAGDGVDEKFSGAVIMDDIDKPADITSLVKTQNTHNLFNNTIYTRYNRNEKNKKGTFINIQQRLGINDMSAFLRDNYDFEVVKCPLVETDGHITAPLSWSEEEIELLKKQEKYFLSQFQQEDVSYGLTLLDYNEFLHYDIDFYNLDIDALIMTTDYAMQDKEKSDYTCLCMWGYKRQYDSKLCNIYLIDMIYGKFRTQDKLYLTKTLFNKYIRKENKYRIMEPRTIIIENNHNEDFIQLLTSEQIPVYIFNRVEAKTTRALTFMNGLHILHDIYLPSERLLNKQLLEAIEMQIKTATGDNKTHDDIVDNIIDSSLIGKLFY